jgi:hypothetical protein
MNPAIRRELPEDDLVVARFREAGGRDAQPGASLVVQDNGGALVSDQRFFCGTPELHLIESARSDRHHDRERHFGRPGRSGEHEDGVSSSIAPRSEIQLEGLRARQEAARHRAFRWTPQAQIERDAGRDDESRFENPPAAGWVVDQSPVPSPGIFKRRL